MFPSETGHAQGRWAMDQAISLPGSVPQMASTEGKEGKLHVSKSDSDSIAQ